MDVAPGPTVTHPSYLPDHDFDAILDAATAAFTLGAYTDHGPQHWLRVERNALRIARSSGADIAVVRLFARLHDCRRENEYHDPLHGVRAAGFARELRGSLIHLTDAHFALLDQALRGHNDGGVSTDPTIGTCWDADRLELPRIGIRPDPRLMSTAAGRELAAAIGR